MEKDFVINEKDNSMAWIYEYNMWKNPGIFITVGKIFLLCALVPVLVVFLCTISEKGFLEALITGIKIYGIVAGIVIALLLLAYPISTIIKGGKYIAVFEMNNSGITHRQLEKQFKRNEAISYISALVGAISGNYTVVASNLLAGAHNSTHSTFKKVRKIIVQRKSNTIKLITSDMYNNHIYVSQERFDYVLDYIIERCKKNVIKKGV